MKAQLREMFIMQDKLNAAINADWLNDGSQDWHCAVLVEGSEMIDHYGWKWWKHQVPDIEQVQLELVDIWHFLMSAELRQYPMLSQEQALDKAVDVWHETLKTPANKEEFLPLAKALVGQAALSNIAYVEFNQLMASVDFDFASLYKWYIGKNVLNYFRQDNGYKDGSYIKVWNGREDNEHLADALKSHACDEQLADNIYQSLTGAYPISK